eukprot:1343430-Lingulodinium_polyedra.AAC.1
MVCNELVAMGCIDAGRAVALSFTAYLRPCDLLSLRVRQLIPPVFPGAPGLGRWALVLYPQQEAKRSKVGEADESIVLDATGF